MCGNNSTGGKHPFVVYPFFCGVVSGALDRPGSLVSGAVRTGSWIGLNGPDAANNIALHNRLTYLTAWHGLNYLRYQNIDPTFLSTVWGQLPRDEQSRAIEWGAETAGAMVGGSAVGTLVTRQLVKYYPKRVVAPVIFFVGCQGFMAKIWNDQWGPQPPPDGSGGGLSA